ncbi:MAG: polysaccharide biosynthesis/export family protein [Candidatus Omnitrophica bacterium]|nr:polysaccharide biosynthesis/export family protein [Candidatus Omnitrophota bacterium]MCF7877173.1 polysaccharide biosynthesis/export family protein [Candidatus Omnitrophota bacterium]MCF7879012.1 polysaccharide biosynthesis/export family protein [Candidatus Omnitrophota bacterium]MCF7891490.1 polysaccharide biosynthesis/export family protein [Candidatus Omnitrophota bacterium]MCF7895569.1 polysaccharide biosynthesis/export family protein [Candidatus Omnitrophota bacterium]
MLYFIIMGYTNINSFLRIFLAGCLALSVLAVEAKAQESKSAYRLGSGDTIEVIVWRNDDLNKEVTIRPDGRLSLPLAGEIIANGLTPSELNKKITLKLEKYIKSPKVSTIVTGFGSKRVLVLGQVKRPGVYSLSRPTTALEAISKAEGYDQFAYLKSVMVIRNGYSDNPEILSANLLKAISKGNLSGDISLQPGDIVYVPKKFIGKAKDFLSFFNSNLKPIADSYINYLDYDDNHH